MDKPEDHIARSFEWFLHKQFNRPLQRFGLLPEPTSPYIKIFLWRYMRGAPIVFAGSTPFAWFGIRVYLVHMVFAQLTLHQIERHLRPLLHIVFDPSYLELLLILCLSAMPTILWTGCLGLSVSSWNQRASSLNQDGVVPLPAAAATPGVWPPPPLVPAKDLPTL